MRGHGAYSLTSTTTSMRFGAEALLAIVRRRQREAPESTQLSIPQDDWFAAHQRPRGGDIRGHVGGGASSGPGHHARNCRWLGLGAALADFSYKDTLSVPSMDMYDSRVIRFKLLEYDSMLVFDRVTGISIRPVGFLSAVFAVLGKPDLKQTRIAISPDQWQVIRGQVKVFAGISKTGHGDDRARRTRPRGHSTKPNGSWCPGGALEAAAQAPLRGTLVSGSAEDGSPRRSRSGKRKSTTLSSLVAVATVIGGVAMACTSPALGAQGGASDGSMRPLAATYAYTGEVVGNAAGGPAGAQWPSASRACS